MSTVLARFTRGGDRIKIVADLEPGYHVILTTPADPQDGPRVERFQSRYLLLHLDLYEAAGYRRLILCQTCHGSGRYWHRDRDQEDVCDECQGEGGT